MTLPDQPGPNTSADWPLEAPALKPEDFKPPRGRILALAAIVIAIVVAAAVLLPLLTVQDKKERLVQDTRERLSILAQGRADVLSTWVAGTAGQADRLADSELFRLFATEVDVLGGDLSQVPPDDPTQEDPDQAGLEPSLLEQLPFVERLLTDFAEGAPFNAAYLIGRKGEIYAASAGAPGVAPAQQEVALRVFEDGKIHYGPLRETSGGLLLDIYRPIVSAQLEAGATETVGVVLLPTPVGRILKDSVAPQPLAQLGERALLIEATGDGSRLVQPQGATVLSPIEDSLWRIEAEGISFGDRPSLLSTASAYTVGLPVTGPAWYAVQERDVAAAAQEIEAYIRTAAVVAGLVLTAIIAAFVAFWWRLNSSHTASLATQFHDLAGRIAAQKRLLDGINDTIGEWIALKGADGKYRYVNPAFATAVGRERDAIAGLDDKALFGAGTAERLVVAEERARGTGSPVTSEEEIHLGSKLRYLQISRVPYSGTSKKTSGMISVIRDVTELTEQRRKREQAVQQTVSALVRAIELRDPYLAGHSRRVAGFAGAIARQLQADEMEIMTIELAALLSQVGKLAVPREIVAKPTRLNEVEQVVMQEHVSHAAKVIQNIDFELPVLDLIYQMHERLDGGGYPNGLKGDEISQSGRILGVCDVFCARVEPRSYRAGLPVGEALDVLDENSGRYDPRIVTALRDVVRSVAGEKLIAGIKG